MPIVVLYKQSIEQSVTLQTLNAGLKVANVTMDVFVYDNSPAKGSYAKKFRWNQFNIHYVPDQRNSGLSKAYNSGADAARALSKEWILLLDQDTSFPLNIFNNYFNAVAAHSAVSLFAPILKLSNGRIFSPCINKHKRGYPVEEISSGEYNLKQFSPVNSGILVKLDLFLRVGGYNENVKVDFCDFQFLEKVQKVNPSFYLIQSIALQDFSSDEVSVEKQMQRFKIYLEDARNCKKYTVADRLGFFYTVTRHAVGLTVKLRKVSFIKVYLLKYLFS